MPMRRCASADAADDEDHNGTARAFVVCFLQSPSKRPFRSAAGTVWREPKEGYPRKGQINVGDTGRGETSGAFSATLLTAVFSQCRRHGME